MYFAVYGTHKKGHYRYTDLSDEQTRWMDARHCTTTIVWDEITPDAQTPNTSDNMEIGQ